MQFIREVNRVMLGVLAGFLLVGAAATYWAVIGPDSILRREDNPRLVEAEARIQRGDIVDRHDVTLVDYDDGTRVYTQPATWGALGYYSLRYGVAGVEEAYDSLLRGTAFIDDAAIRDLMHETQRGGALRVTLDLDIQQAVFQAMGAQRGAAVVLSVPSGEVLALVSLPTYDPNRLDLDWDRLREDPANPFFNRALQGRYQPGGALETPLLATALLDNQPLDSELPGATDTVLLNGLELECAVRLPALDLTLRDAYAFACPQPFESLAQSLGLPPLNASYQTLSLLAVDPLAINGTTAMLTPEATAEAEATVTLDPVEAVLANALGQGNLTVSPMQMALMAAAIVNDGNAPTPYLVSDMRPPDGEWQSLAPVRPAIPFTTANTARRLQDLMRYAVANGAAQNAGRPDIDIGGHAALAYTGDSTVVWFVGFATLGGQQGVAVAIVLEDSRDPGLAADIGGVALTAAQAAIAGD